MRLPVLGITADQLARLKERDRLLSLIRRRLLAAGVPREALRSEVRRILSGGATRLTA